MNKQKKPLYRYYTIILIVIMAVNFIIFPMFQQSKLETTNYSDFLNKIEEKKIDTVQIEKYIDKLLHKQITRDEKIYLIVHITRITTH